MNPLIQMTQFSLVVLAFVLPFNHPPLIMQRVHEDDRDIIYMSKKHQIAWFPWWITSKKGNAASKMKNTPPCITERGSLGSSIKLKKRREHSVQKKIYENRQKTLVINLEYGVDHPIRKKISRKLSLVKTN